MINSRNLSLPIITLVLLEVISPRLAMACSCGVSLLQTKYEYSQNVLTAFITGGEATAGPDGRSSNLRTTFKTTEVFKGAVPFEFLSSHVNGGSCGISLRVGVEYLIFAPNTGEIGLCSGILVVSGISFSGEESGPKYVAALRAYTSGVTDELPEPWHFSDSSEMCWLSGSFPYGEHRTQATIEVGFRKIWPESVEFDAEEPHFQPGFTQLSVRVPGREDLTNFPLSIFTTRDEYSAHWKVDRYKQGRYRMLGQSVIEFVAEIDAAEIIYFRSGHPVHGAISAKASLANAGNSVSRMLQCIREQ